MGDMGVSEHAIMYNDFFCNFNMIVNYIYMYSLAKS